MSRENVEAVRRANDAFNRGDIDAAFADYHQDVQWRDLQHAPDSPERLSGLAALRAYWAQWDDAFDRFTAEIDECIDVDECVIACTRWSAQGKDSGILLDQRTVDVFEFAEGKIVRATMGYASKAEALEALRVAG